MGSQESETTMDKTTTPPLSNLDLNEWKQRAQEEQNKHYEATHMSYMRFKTSEKSLIVDKILHTFFEKPAGSDDYTSKQCLFANKLCSKIINISASDEDPRIVNMTFIYVLGRTNKVVFQEPVIRVLRSRDTNGSEKHYFVDRLARVYDGWQDWLDHNVLAKCIYCYPRNGVYCSGVEAGTVLVDFGKSPACSLFANAIRITNVVVTVGSVIIVIIICLPFFIDIPPAYLTTIIVLRVIEAITVSSLCILKLRDKYKHKERLSDCKAIYIWLGLLCAILDLIFGD